MNCQFHPEAGEEFLAAIDWYEGHEKDLGLEFAREVYAAIGRAIQRPQAWPVLEGDVRRCQTRRFPCGVLYSKEADGVFVLAVMHLRRDPDYWKHRLG